MLEVMRINATSAASSPLVITWRTPWCWQLNDWSVAAEECALRGKVGFFAKAVVHYGERQGRRVHLLRLPEFCTEYSVHTRNYDYFSQEEK